MSKEVLCDDNICTLTLENPREGVLFLHCTVNEYSKSVLKRTRERVWDVMEEIRQDGYGELFALTQNRRFAQFVDGDFTTLDRLEQDGKTFEVLVWDLTQ